MLNILCLGTLLVSAGPSLLNELPPQIVLLNELVTLEPKEGHHFNLKAPQNCGPFGWSKQSAQKLVCQVNERTNFEIQVSICDDAMSFCKLEKHSVAVMGANPAVSPQPKSEGPLVIDKNGFYLGHLEAAQKKARRENKFILLDFYGTWCPPCNGLDQYVFSNLDFKKVASGIIKVRLDVDKDVFQRWIEKFKVYNYPTLIVVNSELEEMGRMVGYDYGAASSISNWIINQTKQTMTLEQAKQRLSTAPTDELRYRLASRYYWQNDWSGAIEAAGNSRNPRVLKYALKAEWRLSQRLEDNESQKKILKKLLQEIRNDPEWPDWVLAYSELSPAEAKPYLTVALTLIEDLEKQNPPYGDTDYTRADLIATLAEIRMAMGEKEKAREAYLRAAAEWGKIAKSFSSSEIVRGPQMSQAFLLMQAEAYLEAEKILSALAQTFSDQWTFNYRYAKVLLKLKRFPEALKFAEKACEHAYGTYVFWAQALAGEIEIELGKKKVAKKRISKVLSNLQLPKTPRTDLQEAVVRLREVLKKASDS